MSDAYIYLQGYQFQESYLNSFLEAMAEQIEDPASLFQFKRTLIFTEELSKSLTRHSHTFHFILCFLQTFFSHLRTGTVPGYLLKHNAFVTVHIYLQPQTNRTIKHHLQ